jgi:hypothetical protein
MSKRDKRVAEKRKKAAVVRQRDRAERKDRRKAEKLRRSGYEPPKPDPGTPCQTCLEANVEMSSDVEPLEAGAYWLGNDQNPDPEARLYSMVPVCIFHSKFWHALYSRHADTHPGGDQMDLYGWPDRTPDETLTIEGLVALMTKSLNDELDLKVRNPRKKVTFHDEDMIRHALQWTRNDMLIMGAWATVMKEMLEQGSYLAAGPKDVVDDESGGSSAPPN